jgi:XTP/dITP diphosphohydrolase
MQIVIATNNKGKKKEFQELLQNQDMHISCLEDFPHIPDPRETQSSFDGNALQKATFVFTHLSNIQNKIVIADDSGLCVDALHGAPGIYSKRYSKEQTTESNNKKLLEALSSITQRNAHFHCSIAIVSPKGTWVVQGRCPGRIAHTQSGERGFGYDPLFIPQKFPEKTMATITSEEKNEISHRGVALKKALPIILEQILL